MSDPEIEQLWAFVGAQTKILMRLANVCAQMTTNKKDLDRLMLLLDSMRELGDAYKARFERLRADQPFDATAELYERVASLEEAHAAHEADRQRPVEITIVKEFPHA